MRIMVCEDNIGMQQSLSEAIKGWAKARGAQADVLCYESAEAFLMAWPEISFDLAFIDIQMKNMDGVELAKTIRKTDKNMMIVFATSFSQYVLKGYDVNALHYLIKPLSKAKLMPVLDKAHEIWRSRENGALLVADGNGLIKLPLADIYSISMLSHTAQIATESKSYELRKTAAELSKMLPWHFVRCHRSYIANLLKVDCVYKDSLLLSNGESLPVSRKMHKAVSEAFVRLYTGMQS